MAQTEMASGLEGVVVAQTRLSDVDGERGRLVIAGQDVEQLALARTFEEVCALLWTGEIPVDTLRMQTALGEARVRAWTLLSSSNDALALPDGMDALRAMVGRMDSRATREEITGAVAVFAAAWSRRREGKQPVMPDASLGNAADYLRMVRGARAGDAEVSALQSYLVTVTDHGMNASTFAARVVASTGSDMVSSVTAAIGALKGPLHGGAPGPVLDMLDAVGTPANAEKWLETELAAGRRIMGMGHRIYRVRDPRAAVLEKAIERLERAGVTTGRLALARAVEKAAEQVLSARYPNRPLKANVEFYTAVLLDTVRLPRTLFSPTFTVGRVVGWTAHVEEQRATGRLIRPASTYVGPAPALTA
ncbi:MAG: citrate synthase [Myxococcota bacterium]